MESQGRVGQKLKAFTSRETVFLPGSAFSGGGRAFFIYVTIEGIRHPHIQLVPASKRSQVVVDVLKQSDQPSSMC